VGFLLSLIVAGAGFGLILIAVMLAWQHERNCIRAELAEEIGHTLSEQEFSLLSGRWHRPLGKRNPSVRRQAQRMQLYVELALRKQRLRLLGEAREPELMKEIQRIRNQLADRSSPV
jgi:hypothetical protein